MAHFRFIHAGDIHLDSPFQGIQHYESAPVEQMISATRQALVNLVEMAIREGVSFVVVAGDLYDGDWKDYNTGLFFVGQMARLRDAGISVVMIAGNHDASSQITRSLRMPDNVRLLSEQRPESFEVTSVGAVVHGRSYPSRSVTFDLSAEYPDRIPGLFNIGLLHTCVEGQEGHEPYAPCSRQGLISKGYDYWALGHVHARQELCKEPWIVYSGNTQGRHIRETGPKGCTIVTVEDGTVLSANHVSLDVLRWSLCTVDVTGTTTPDEVIDRAEHAIAHESEQNQGYPLVIRVVLTGSCAAHRLLASDVDRWTNEVRGVANGLGDGQIWVERIRIQTSPESETADNALSRDDALGGLLRSIRDLSADGQSLADLCPELIDLQRRLPPDLRDGLDGLDFNDANLVQATLQDVKNLLLARLLSI